MLGTMRDTSRDYRTYWIRDGLYYGKMNGLGAAEVSCALQKEQLDRIPEADRKILLEEVSSDPAFCARIAKCMATRPDCAHVIAAGAKQAIANELNPRMYPNRKGEWPKLRARVRELVEEAHKAVLQAVQSLSAAEKLAIVRKLAGGQVIEAGVSGLGELGQWDIIASLVGSIGKTAADTYNTKVIQDTQEDIAKLQAGAAMQSAQAQMAIASANAAIANAQARQASPISSALSTTVGGIPVLAIAIPVLGAILYFMFKK